MSRRSKSKPRRQNQIVNQMHGVSPSSLTSVRAQVAIASWAAPLPPPDLLTRYNEAFPGCAERIVDNAEKQSTHRQALEKSALDGKLGNERRGQTMAFILALVILFGGFFLIYLNKSVLGTIFIGTDVAALVSVFVYGKKDQKSQLQTKARETFQTPDSNK